MAKKNSPTFASTQVNHNFVFSTRNLNVDPSDEGELVPKSSRGEKFAAALISSAEFASQVEMQKQLQRKSYELEVKSPTTPVDLLSGRQLKAKTMPANARLSLNVEEKSSQNDPVKVSQIKLDLKNEPSNVSPLKEKGSQGLDAKATNEKAMLKGRPKKDIATKHNDKKAGCLPNGCTIF